MSKKNVLISAHVIVDVPAPYFPDSPTFIERYQIAADSIVKNIRRHVDDIGHVYVENEYQDECEHCGSQWTEDSSTYNGGCCAKDQEAQDALEARLTSVQP